MKKLFTAIRKGDIDAVCRLLDQDPPLISCEAQTPKRILGLSPLQTALRAEQFAIAGELLDRGADVNFIESPVWGKSWRIPVVQDAVRMAVMFTRWNINDPQLGLRLCHTQAEADQTFALLERVFQLGGDIQTLDSKGNSCLDIAVMYAQEVLPPYDVRTGTTYTIRTLTPELEADLTRIFDLLYALGADPDYIRPGFDQTIRERCARGPISRFIK